MSLAPKSKEMEIKGIDIACNVCIHSQTFESDCY